MVMSYLHNLQRCFAQMHFSTFVKLRHVLLAKSHIYVYIREIELNALRMKSKNILPTSKIQ